MAIFIVFFEVIQLHSAQYISQRDDNHKRYKHGRFTGLNCCGFHPKKFFTGNLSRCLTFNIYCTKLNKYSQKSFTVLLKNAKIQPSESFHAIYLISHHLLVFQKATNHCLNVKCALFIVILHAPDVSMTMMYHYLVNECINQCLVMLLSMLQLRRH